MSKWQFMMDYCKEMGYNPAFSFYWSKAEIKWKEVYE